ncbi:hypothetical protein ACIQY5_16950 [Peribacillus frigoritolerans]|uniref:hypothetical protein n=1 Tax=Peribacillus frigoritolerans TaxID=450367 RepID=UPI0038017FC0
MDWSEKNWLEEDKLFFPKRKVNNRDSKNISHVIGHLYSYKMKRTVGWESFWGEYLFYQYLELDFDTIRYYEQPVEVPVVNLKKENELNVWAHVPDVLVFRQGHKPLLYQIKGGNSEPESELDSLINFKCREFVKEREWIYHIIRPKELPEVIKSNILLLRHFQRPRTYYTSWEKELVQKISYLSGVSILELANSFSGKTDYRLILPLVYHLITRGVLKTNINVDINEKSIVQLGNIGEALTEFIGGVDGNAGQIRN